MQAAEIDYMLFAYDHMFNHIEDVLFPLGTPMALGSLECATVFTAALVKMKAKLQEYHDKTNIPFFGRGRYDPQPPMETLDFRRKDLVRYRSRIICSRMQPSL